MSNEILELILRLQAIQKTSLLEIIANFFTIITGLASCYLFYLEFFAKLQYVSQGFQSQKTFPAFKQYRVRLYNKRLRAQLIKKVDFVFDNNYILDGDKLVDKDQYPIKIEGRHFGDVLSSKITKLLTDEEDIASKIEDITQIIVHFDGDGSKKLIINTPFFKKTKDKYIELDLFYKALWNIRFKININGQEYYIQKNGFIENSPFTEFNKIDEKLNCEQLFNYFTSILKNDVAFSIQGDKQKFENQAMIDGKKHKSIFEFH